MCVCVFNTPCYTPHSRVENDNAEAMMRSGFVFPCKNNHLDIFKYTLPCSFEDVSMVVLTTYLLYVRAGQYGQN